MYDFKEEMILLDQLLRTYQVHHLFYRRVCSRYFDCLVNFVNQQGDSAIAEPIIGMRLLHSKWLHLRLQHPLQIKSLLPSLHFYRRRSKPLLLSLSRIRMKLICLLIPFLLELPGLILVVAIISAADRDEPFQPLDRALRSNSLEFLDFIK